MSVVSKIVRQAAVNRDPSDQLLVGGTQIGNTEFPSGHSTGHHLVISNVFPPQVGGSGRWLWEVYHRLAADQAISFLVPECPQAESFDAECELPIERACFDLQETGAFRPSGILGYSKLFQRVRNIHRKSPLSLLHCACAITPGWVGWMFRKTYGVPYVCYVHGEEVNLSEPLAGLLSSRQHRVMTRLVLSGAAKIVSNSRNTSEILVRDWNIPAQRIATIHPGVDTEAFTPTLSCNAMRADLGWSGRRVLLTVGRLQQRKGHDMLIRALAKIRESIPNILYAIVGDGEEYQTLEELTRDLGLQHHVAFYRSISDGDLIRMYQQCDLFVLPNRQIGGDIEGFGIVLLEAQACGKPVLAGNSGGTRETMQTPDTGRLVCCDTPSELETAVVQMLQQPERLMEMGENARRWIETQFSWPKIAQKTVDEIWPCGIKQR